MHIQYVALVAAAALVASAHGLQAVAESGDPREAGPPPHAPLVGGGAGPYRKLRAADDGYDNDSDNGHYVGENRNGYYNNNGHYNHNGYYNHNYNRNGNYNGDSKDSEDRIFNSLRSSKSANNGMVDEGKQNDDSSDSSVSSSSSDVSKLSKSQTTSGSGHRGKGFSRYLPASVGGN